jgi:desulfoferrodoxin-like iron-binding protein
MANEIGKRYVCAVCGSELLVTKAGFGTLSCCGQPMQLKAAASGAK